MSMLGWIVKAVIGSKNDREVKRMRPVIAAINDMEPTLQKLGDDQLKAFWPNWKQRHENGESLDSLLPEVFAVTREVSRRVLNMRHYDVQLIGGMVLHTGKIAEMKTGEGKTLVATCPVVLNAIAGKGVHVVTVNDYLAKRDAAWMGRIYKALGMTVGCVVHELEDNERQREYRCDVTYGQNNEFGFDYLRDNMKFDLAEYVQRDLHYAIVDEVDNILIDEARTPLIISGPTDESTDKYYRINSIIPGLKRDEDYTVDEKARTVVLTDAGVERVEKRLNVGNLYDPGNIETLHHVNQALRAHTLYRNEVEYVVKDGQVLIVDEFTGRLMEGRRWSDGLHQAVEAKEGVNIENENQTLATISFQNYFRIYKKLAGMTGTADTEAPEFAKTYNLDVTVIPPNLPMIRKDKGDVVYKSEKEKFLAIVEEIKECHSRGQPVLVGTISIEKSETIAKLLKRDGVPHHVLNAKHHEKEAFIVAQAGRKGQVTIATNMAGRGTDILLGGNAEYLALQEVGKEKEGSPEYQRALEKFRAQCAAEKQEVVAAGGLHILGTERHEARRIDNQLRGRAGRQGDPGTSRFYLSLEDDLLRIFGGERIGAMMERLGVPDDEPIEHRFLTRAIENAQKKVEAHNFEMRKHLLEYDDVMNQQRKTIYELRRRVLSGDALRDQVYDVYDDLIVAAIEQFCPENKHPDEWDTRAVEEALFEIFAARVSYEGVEPNHETLQDVAWKVIETAYKAREERFGAEAMKELEKWIYLNGIDHQWKDHLLAMDHLREGIGLRGYGQKDPKLEYKKEGFEMFVEMLERIKRDVASKLMRVEIENMEQLEEFKPEEQEMHMRHDSYAGGGDGESGEEGDEAKPVTVMRQQPKVGRNDPCPCGSGKKYKKCCLLKGINYDAPRPVNNEDDAHA
jgi:preprotein translocase subunit SecA